MLGSSERLGKIGEENVFYLTDDVFLSQRDVRELQFAKASIATGWAILCNDMGVEPEEIAQVLLGGSFGSYLSAGERGEDRARAEAAAHAHRRRRATSPARARRSPRSRSPSAPPRSAVLDEVEYVELSGRTDFNDLFIDQLSFPA